VWQQELYTFPKYSAHPESEEKKDRIFAAEAKRKRKRLLT